MLTVVNELLTKHSLSVRLQTLLFQTLSLLLPVLPFCLELENLCIMLFTNILIPRAFEALPVLEGQGAVALHDIAIPHAATILHPKIISRIDQTVVENERSILAEHDSRSDPVRPCVDP